jgi:predicted small lipoprotein YifL
MATGIRIGVIAFAAAVLLAGCGVRGALEKPSASGAAPAEDTAQADSGQGKKAGDTPKPHKPFILDKILE